MMPLAAGPMLPIAGHHGTEMTIEPFAASIMAAASSGGWTPDSLAGGHRSPSVSFSHGDVIPLPGDDTPAHKGSSCRHQQSGAVVASPSSMSMPPPPLPLPFMDIAMQQQYRPIKLIRHEHTHTQQRDDQRQQQQHASGGSTAEQQRDPPDRSAAAGGGREGCGWERRAGASRALLVPGQLVQVACGFCGGQVKWRDGTIAAAATDAVRICVDTPATSGGSKSRKGSPVGSKEVICSTERFIGDDEDACERACLSPSSGMFRLRPEGFEQSTTTATAANTLQPGSVVCVWSDSNKGYDDAVVLEVWRYAARQHKPTEIKVRYLNGGQEKRLNLTSVHYKHSWTYALPSRINPTSTHDSAPPPAPCADPRRGGGSPWRVPTLCSHPPAVLRQLGLRARRKRSNSSAAAAAMDRQLSPEVTISWDCVSEAYCVTRPTKRQATGKRLVCHDPPEFRMATRHFRSHDWGGRQVARAAAMQYFEKCEQRADRWKARHEHKEPGGGGEEEEESEAIPPLSHDADVDMSPASVPTLASSRTRRHNNSQALEAAESPHPDDAIDTQPLRKASRPPSKRPKSGASAGRGRSARGRGRGGKGGRRRRAASAAEVVPPIQGHYPQYGEGGCSGNRAHGGRDRDVSPSFLGVIESAIEGFGAGTQLGEGGRSVARTSKEIFSRMMADGGEGGEGEGEEANAAAAAAESTEEPSLPVAADEWASDAVRMTRSRRKLEETNLAVADSNSSKKHKKANCHPHSHSHTDQASEMTVASSPANKEGPNSRDSSGKAKPDKQQDKKGRIRGPDGRFITKKRQPDGSPLIENPPPAHRPATAAGTSGRGRGRGIGRGRRRRSSWSRSRRPRRPQMGASEHQDTAAAGGMDEGEVESANDDDHEGEDEDENENEDTNSRQAADDGSDTRHGLDDEVAIERQQLGEHEGDGGTDDAARGEGQPADAHADKTETPPPHHEEAEDDQHEPPLPLHPLSLSAPPLVNDAGRHGGPDKGDGRATGGSLDMDDDHAPEEAPSSHRFDHTQLSARVRPPFTLTSERATGDLVPQVAMEPFHPSHDGNDGCFDYSDSQHEEDHDERPPAPTSSAPRSRSRRRQLQRPVVRSSDVIVLSEDEDGAAKKAGGGQCHRPARPPAPTPPVGREEMPPGHPAAVMHPSEPSASSSAEGQGSGGQ
ncbi:unnamed protein product [Vitrella brassicaformis CCMP3155]|uniref:Uncharacterized protein n=3 Tax=Vitrella brassicaformis TaxID=1169539 RepID=A0A0G4G7U4_VITBC|nr:unnamed protein product [Vitrella brassicaformis CCMP3155]|eukprot:CEM24568.1 unnamed protein product [Vitrella brassicaformis CCMP3155]